MIRVGATISLLMSCSHEVQHQNEKQKVFKVSNQDELVSSNALWLSKNHENACHGKLRVLTYNFYLRPPLVKENQSDFKKERLHLFMENEIHKYDVIAFQEVFTTYWQSQIIQLAKRKGFSYSALGPSASLFSWPIRVLDSGLLLISRYPIAETQIMSFKNGASYDQFSNKGALYTRIAMTSETKPYSYVDIIVTHTQASYDDSSLNHPTTKARLNQVAELHEWMKKLFPNSEKKYPKILLGDFNINSRPERPLCQREMPKDHLSRSKIPMLDDEKFLDGQKHTEEYLIALKKLNYGMKEDQYFNWRDVLFERKNFHLPTYGVGDLERVITERKSSNLNWSLDYIFYEPANDKRWSIKDPKTSEIDVKTVSFTIPESEIYRDTHINRGLTQLSDHFGIELVMRFTWPQ